MNTIVHAKEENKKEILNLYRSQIGREFCPWDEHYPSEYEIDYDLSRDALFIMKDDSDRIIAAISLDLDEQVNALDCWSKKLEPGCEIARIAVLPECQNQGLARLMLSYAFDEIKARGYKSVRFMVNKYNTKALRSYAAFNIPSVGECFMYNQDFICFEKEL